MKERRSANIKNIVLWAVFLGGLLLSYLGFQVARELENRTLQVEQQRITQMAGDALSKELEVSQRILSGIKGLFLASSHVTRNEFFLFTESELKAHPSIKALEWIPHLLDTEREAYRQQAIRDGLLDFDIRERSPQDAMVTAKQRDEYFPVYYVEPLQRNKRVLGFDLASSEERRVSLERARHTGVTQVTASVSLVQERGEQKGFLIFQPVYKKVSSSSDAQESLFRGFALGVFRIGDLFESGTEPIGALLGPLVIELADITDPQNSELLHSTANGNHSDLSADVGSRVTQDIRFANRTWRLSSFSTPQFRHNYSASTHWLVLFVGFALTLMTTGYLRTLMRRETEVKKLVAQRTQELHASEQMGRVIVESAVDAIITIDALGTVDLFSPAAERLFGYSADEVIGRNVKILMPEPYQSEHDGYLLHHQQTGEKRIIGVGRQVSGQRKDGSVFPMNLSVGEAHINGKKLYVGTISDLSELKENEEKLVEYNRRLELATRAGSIGIWDYDIVNRSLDWDDRMFELYGLSRDSFSGVYKAWVNALYPDDLKRVEEELADAINGGEPLDTEFPIHWPDGQVRYIHAYGVVLFDGEGRGNRMIGVNLDVTQHKRAEQAMRQAKQAAEEANRQKSVFLNVMSHELRTPLTVVLGYLPLLKNREQPLPPEAIASIAEDMDLSGQHLLEMINDLLDISKIEAGEMSLFLEQAQSLTLIQEMLYKFKFQAQQKQIELLCDSEDFSFQADVRRLKQILINLIGNALKFTPQGSIKITASRDNAYVTFNVIDTGIGIPEAEMPLIFDAFSQVDDSSTRKAGGSGLGLAITKRLVELHGGAIKAESKMGSGTTFTFTIKQ